MVLHGGGIIPNRQNNSSAPEVLPPYQGVWGVTVFS
jgi:hypothetical protein